MGGMFLLILISSPLLLIWMLTFRPVVELQLQINSVTTRTFLQ